MKENSWYYMKVSFKHSFSRKLLKEAGGGRAFTQNVFSQWTQVQVFWLFSTLEESLRPGLVSNIQCSCTPYNKDTRYSFKSLTHTLMARVTFIGFMKQGGKLIFKGFGVGGVIIAHQRPHRRVISPVLPRERERKRRTDRQTDRQTEEEKSIKSVSLSLWGFHI